MTAMCVVSFDTPAESSPRDIASSLAAVVPSAMSKRAYGQLFTLVSYGSGSPAMNAFDARRGSINAARAFA